MITRRFLSLAAVTTPLLAGPMFTGHAWADATDAARDLVVRLGRDLTAVANGPEVAAARKASLERLIYAAVDVDAVARFCLGRFWRGATPQQQKDYTDLFRAVLVRNIAGKAGEYKGVVMDVGKAQPHEEDVAVTSVVTRPGIAPSKVDWIVSSASGSPRIIDVIAEATSLRLTQRSDYAAFLASHGNNVQALIDAMKTRAVAPAPG